MKEKPHVQQAHNELENALAHGNGERAKAARKALAAAGLEEAAQARKSAAADEGEQEQRSAPPKGRSRKPQQTTEQQRRESAAGDGDIAEVDSGDQPRRKPGERLNLG